LAISRSLNLRRTVFRRPEDDRVQPSLQFRRR
jgi:hypothetical protein